MPTNPYRRVLLIAPSDSGLNVAPEVDSLYEFGFQVQAVQGEVTRQRVFDVARRMKADIVHFAGHADEERVELSKDDSLDSVSIVQLAKTVDATLVFLNGCSTAELGQVLVDEDVPAALCTLRSVPDDMARETAMCFYRELASVGDIRQAYHQSKPPVKGGYSLFTDGIYETLNIEPILAKLDEFQRVIESNTTEHNEFKRSIHDMAVSCGDFHQQKVWFLKVSGGLVVGSLALQALITVLAGGPK